MVILVRSVGGFLRTHITVDLGFLFTGPGSSTYLWVWALWCAALLVSATLQLRQLTAAASVLYPT